MLNGKVKTGVSREIQLIFPVNWLQKGINRIRLGAVKGHWVLVDAMCLEVPAGVRLGKAWLF
ncbi:MAG: hypothetical protein V8S95_04160 [Odoribacter sp.]